MGGATGGCGAIRGASGAELVMVKFHFPNHKRGMWGYYLSFVMVKFHFPRGGVCGAPPMVKFHFPTHPGGLWGYYCGEVSLPHPSGTVIGESFPHPRKDRNGRVLGGRWGFGSYLGTLGPWLTAFGGLWVGFGASVGLGVGPFRPWGALRRLVAPRTVAHERSRF